MHFWPLGEFTLTLVAKGDSRSEDGVEVTCLILSNQQLIGVLLRIQWRETLGYLG